MIQYLKKHTVFDKVCIRHYLSSVIPSVINNDMNTVFELQEWTEKKAKTWENGGQNSNLVIPQQNLCSMEEERGHI